MLASIATAADEVLRVEERVENGVRESAAKAGKEQRMKKPYGKGRATRPGPE